MSAIIQKCYVGQSEDYYNDELVSERENYYAETENRAGQWAGRGAAVLELKGDVTKEKFSQMSRGINPATGKRFRRITLGRTREVNGETKQVKEIANWGLILSAPKSISIVALIGGEERVRQAHLDSATVAFDRAERQAQANLGGGKKEQTGNLIAARFSHDSARPSSKSGLVAPQLHEHFVIENATVLPDGTIRPLEPSELYKAQSYIRTVYYVELADRLQKLGYEIEIDGKTGAPEIAEISKEYRLACSPRRTEILELAKKAGRNFRQLSIANRRRKVFDKDLIREQHKGIDGFFDFQALRAVEKARKTAPTIKPDAAKESVAFALAKLSKRESVFNPRVILLEANKHGVGRTSVAAVEAELETRRKDGRIKTVRLRDGREAVLLASGAQIETELPNHIKAVQPTDALHDEISKAEIPDGVKETDEIEFRKLSYEQQRAVKQILRAKTGVVTLEGHPGVGKSVAISFVNKMAERTGYEVLGLAPATDAAQQLGNAEITISTLQKLLTTQDAPRDHKRFFIVDESSFVSSRQMDKFFREAVKPNDRVLLVGNMRRHEGIEAGQPSANIEREELADGAKVGTVRRRTNKSDRETVKNFSEEKIIEAVSEMRERGQIREVKNRAERHSAIIEAFITEPEKSLVVAPRNADRHEINRKIHQSLKEAGKVGKEETEIKILRPRSELGGIERESAAAYREGDIITYTRGSRENQIPAKSLARVIKTDRERNLLTVEIKDGTDGKEAREVTYNPKRLRGVSVWTEEKIKVSTGDRLQLRAPFEEKKTKIADGTMLKVGKITPKALTLTTDKDKTVKLKTDQPQAIDYGYAVTSHSSQEKTIDRVLIHAETTESKQILSERMARVAVSRARDEALIFTDDAERFARKMARQIEKAEIKQTKAEAIEYARQSSEIKPPLVTSASYILSRPETVIRLAREKTIVPDAKPELAKTEQLRQTAAEKLPTPTIEIELAQQESISLDAKPEAARVEREETEIHPARKETVVLDAKLEVERGEVEPPVILPEAPTLPTAEVKAQPPMPQTTGSAGDEKYSRETLIKEVLQISRDSLAKQGINPDPQAWKLLANAVINYAPNQEPSNSLLEILRDLEKNAPPSDERASLAVKTRLEAAHAILKAAPENQRDEIVKNILSEYEKKVAAERADVVVKPEIKPEIIPEVKAERGDAVKPEINKVAELEIKEPVQTTQVETAAVAPVKPALKVRNFAGVGREELISELVADARAEARVWTGKDLSYSQEKRLTKMYRQFGDKKPFDKQTDDLNRLQERFSEPFPQPKNLIEAAVLKRDNLTDAEKSAALRLQIQELNEIVKLEEAQKIKSVGASGQADEHDVFGRTDGYFIQRLHRTNMQPPGKSYYQLTIEAQQRGFLSPHSFNEPEDVQEKQIQQALYQMGIANALQQQVKKSLDEQGILLESSTRKIMNATIDNLANQPLNAEEFDKVREVNRSRFSGGLTAQNKLEAKSYINTYCEEEERDDFSASLASAAAKKAAEIKPQLPQEEEVKVEREIKRGNTDNFDEGQSRTRGRSR